MQEADDVDDDVDDHVPAVQELHTLDDVAPEVDE